MPGSDSVRLVEAASAEALRAARWESIDLATRRPGGAHRDLLLARAAELAMSPVARDQLMSLALERGALESQPDTSLIDVQERSHERARIAKRVFGSDPHRASETEALVALIEARHSSGPAQDGRFDRLSERLEQDAILHEALWDHPDIPASDAVRLAMLCAIPKLRDRAEALSPPAWPWLSALLRWFNPVSGRGVR